MAEQKLKAATIPAPALDGRQTELVYCGRKKADTKRGNVMIPYHYYLWGCGKVLLSLLSSFLLA
jgi:hypothetical protein